MEYSDIKEIIGVLGKPLGTIVEIEGQLDSGERSKAEMDKIMFRVIKVDGKNLEQAVVLPIEIFSWMSVPEPKQGETVRYLAYETGGMTGIPEQAFAHMPYVTTTDFAFCLYLQIIKQLD